MLTFIVGAAASGKTRYVQKLAGGVAGSGGAVTLIVPEQFVFSTEQMMLEQAGEGYVRSAEVFSLSRIAHRLGADGCKTADKAAKRALMALALAQVGSSLTMYKKAAARPDFVPSAVDAVHRMKALGIEGEILDRLCDGAKTPALKAKLCDLRLIMNAYSEVMGDKYFDPDDDMRRLAEKLSSDNPFEGHCVIFDSFKDFTPAEYEVVRRLVRGAASAYFTLTGDRETFGKCTDTDLFSENDRCAKRLSALAGLDGVELGETVFLENNHFDSAYITALERAYRLNLPAPEAEYDGSVRLVSCSNPSDEAMALACGVENLVRETGWRYSDIVVISRNTEPLRGIYDRALAACGVPFFWDGRKPLSASPVFRFLYNSLRCATGENSRLIDCVKSGFFGLSPTEAGLVENYAFVHCLKKLDAFSQSWTDPEAEKAEAARQKFFPAMSALRNGIRGADAEGFAKAVYGFMLESKIAECLGNLSSLEKLPRLESVMTDQARAYNAIISLLDCFAQTLAGSARQEPRRYISILSIMADSVTIGEIPQYIDALQLGAAGIIRPANVRAVFVVGANEGVFPAPPAEALPFTMSECRELCALEIDIPDNPARWAAGEEYLAYSSLFCAGNRITVSWSATDSEGKEVLNPSSFAVKLRQMLPESAFSTTPLLIEQLAVSPRMALYALSAANPAQRSALEQAMREHGLGDGVDRLNNLSDFGRSFGSRSSSQSLFPTDSTISPSSVESFCRCPFEFFCKYGMKTVPLQSGEVSAISWGNAVHAVLQEMLLRDPEAVLNADSDTLKAEISEMLRIAMPELYEGEMTPSRRFFGDKLVTASHDALISVMRLLVTESYRPAATELKIDGREIPLLTLKFGGRTIRLKGKIDRVDTFSAPDGTDYLRVFDYKTGGKEFSYKYFESGLSLQLAFYTQALCEQGKFSDAVPAGMFYFPLRVKKVALDSESDRSKIAAGSKPCGFMVGDAGIDPLNYKKISDTDFKTVFAIADGHAGRMTAQVEAGDFTPAPNAADANICTYCDYRRMCYRKGAGTEDESDE